MPGEAEVSLLQCCPAVVSYMHAHTHSRRHIHSWKGRRRKSYYYFFKKRNSGEPHTVVFLDESEGDSPKNCCEKGGLLNAALLLTPPLTAFLSKLLPLRSRVEKDVVLGRYLRK